MLLEIQRLSVMWLGSEMVVMVLDSISVLYFHPNIDVQISIMKVYTYFISQSLGLLHMLELYRKNISPVLTYKHQKTLEGRCPTSCFSSLAFLELPLHRFIQTNYDSFGYTHIYTHHITSRVHNRKPHQFSPRFVLFFYRSSLLSVGEACQQLIETRLR